MGSYLALLPLHELDLWGIPQGVVHHVRRGNQFLHQKREKRFVEKRVDKCHVTPDAVSCDMQCHVAYSVVWHAVPCDVQCHVMYSVT